MYIRGEDSARRFIHSHPSPSPSHTPFSPRRPFENLNPSTTTNLVKSVNIPEKNHGLLFHNTTVNISNIIIIHVFLVYYPPFSQYLSSIHPTHLPTFVEWEVKPDGFDN